MIFSNLIYTEYKIKITCHDVTLLDLIKEVKTFTLLAPEFKLPFDDLNFSFWT